MRVMAFRGGRGGRPGGRGAAFRRRNADQADAHRRVAAVAVSMEPIPDPSTAVITALTLESLDRIEHRRVELGAPWPQLVLGPTGVAIVDVCSSEELPDVTVNGPPDGSALWCPQCDLTHGAVTAVREVLEASGLAIPVRMVTVVSAGSTVRAACDPLTAATVIPVDRLADVLSRGPVLPMCVVDQAFACLARSLTTDDRLVMG